MNNQLENKDAVSAAPLVAASPVEIKKDLALQEPSEIRIDASEAQDLDAQADRFVQQLIDFEPADAEQGNDRKQAVEQMGLETQKRTAKQSALLQQPLKALSRKAEEGGDVANALVDLKIQVEELDPGKFDFEPGWFSRAFGRLPGVGTPIKRYFSKYESAQTVIAAIIRSLEIGKDQLLRDNVTLIEDQKQMRDMTHRLQREIKLGQLIEQKLQYKLDRDLAEDAPKRKFVAEELLFPLRQRLIDLQQQLAVNQQGVLAAEILIRNNKELARGVDRALSVTVTALEVGATVAMAVANQKIVLDKLDSVSKTTSDLISGTAARLKTQGVEIHRRASSAQLDLNSLKAAFADIKAAMDDVSSFRMQALPQMANTILELDKMGAEAEQAIAKMEEGNAAAARIKIAAE